MLTEVLHDLVDFARRRQILIPIFLVEDLPISKPSTKQQKQAFPEQWPASPLHNNVLESSGPLLEVQGAVPYRDLHPKVLFPNDKED